ncbi:Gfo/Idh/MocA family protein [Nocardiopsis ansamitocini]|uniref:Oxidoreductase n=1 Tax=Nocardiopsis ansamitocini TaxID=1670832 RepID=A0A9W6P1Z0_9ACTN|nr:Gfo/Idh/MocA family oxidoreductase [Nocardiopsis ansamitocini]GLU45734.1 oxidoreductase [Nocardiopsis ansamitocini]
MSVREPIRVGVIGAGYGSVAHLPAYTALPEFEVVALATSHASSAEAAAARFGIERAYGDYRELCADDRVELVDVVTRPSLHAPMVRAAAAAGRHVLCEAPLAVHSREAEEMSAAVHDAGVRAFVNMQSRFSPGLRTLRRLVAQGWIGRVANVRATAFYPTFTRPAAAPGSLWCADSATGAGSLRVHGLHTLDLINWVFGTTETVSGHAVTSRTSWPMPEGRLRADSVDSAAVTGRLPQGGVFSLHTSWVAWHGSGWSLEAYGDEGMLHASAAGHTGHFPVTLRGARHDTAEPTELFPAGASRTTAGSGVPPLGGLLTAVAESLRSGRDDPDLPTFADGLSLLRTAESVEGALWDGTRSG